MTEKIPPKKRAAPRKAKGVPTEEISPAERPAAFPIAGIGASAGGLEAFEQFFSHLPPDSGIAYVLITHLDPTHDSMLTSILQRVTAMPVREATDNIKVEPNAVYVIPPNRDMALVGGALRLTQPALPRGLRMPIDIFLRSMVHEQGELSIGIILSGTGSDGTLGLRDIHAIGGLAIVQDPESAKYDGMPTSAIQAGYFTLILPPEKMGESLINTLKNLSTRRALPETEGEVTGLDQILNLIVQTTGHDFSQYKKTTIRRRIERRMSQHNIDRIPVYLRYLREYPGEIKSMYKELLINVTSFFRDPSAFLVLSDEVLPQLLGDKPEGSAFRIWIPGCSTGEEAYSFAMLLEEFMEKTRRRFKIQIYATDLDDVAVAQARTGRYLLNVSQDLTPDRLRHFFIKEDNGYRVKKGIREMVIFAVQDITKDPPFTKLDLLSCRNLLIYLEHPLQNRLMQLFNYALKPGGVLFLSPSEGIGNNTDLFVPINRKAKIFRATRSNLTTQAVMASGFHWAALPQGKQTGSGMKKVRETNFSELIRRVLLQSYAPASVVTTLNGDILFVHGETGKYLELPSGSPALNAIGMAREGLREALTQSIDKAANLNTPTLNQELVIRRSDALHPVILSVRPLPDTESNQVLLLITFQDILQPGSAKTPRGSRGAGSIQKRRIEELEHALSVTKENLQVTIEEQQASNEELKSTNEELQSTNEELQSTNEELESSKEEMQSINEELITVNAEFLEKIDQLDNIQNDMKNLLDNIDVGTIFLDRHLTIRRFSRAATHVYRLVASDIGRSLADIKSTLPDETLLDEARGVLDSLVPTEREVLTTEKKWMLVRVQPYRTQDNALLGVVLTFTDITTRIDSDREKHEISLAQDIVDTVSEPLVVLDSDLKVVTAGLSFYRDFQLARDATVGQSIYDLGNGQWRIPEFQEVLEAVLHYNQSFEGYVLERPSPGGGRRTIVINGRRIFNKRDSIPLILLAMKVLDQKQEGTR